MTILGFIGITLESANRQRTIGRRFAVLAAAILAGYSCSALADEWVASFYGGKARTSASDVTLNQPGGTDLRLAQVSWDDESFKPPRRFAASEIGDAACDRRCLLRPSLTDASASWSMSRERRAGVSLTRVNRAGGHRRRFGRPFRHKEAPP